MATEYGFTPQQVGQLTMYQLKVYMLDEKDIGSGTVRFDNKADLDAFQAERQSQREALKEYIRGTSIG